MIPDIFTTQREETDSGLAAELAAAGFRDAVEVGQGGFGVVFRCSQAELDRVVAVKVLTTDLEENRARFLREQQAMGRLTGHPNILPVLAVGETAGGYPYLVMPYCTQGCLQQRIAQQGSLPAVEVVGIGVRISSALVAAHRSGVVHRDVKPGNILINDYGEPALSDFGIAHLTNGFRTATGIFTGSPAFTAPEVLSGEASTEMSDVYGLGATLFCALSGHAPYERRRGEHVVGHFLRITTDPLPDLRERGITDDIADIIETAMAREPADRLNAAQFSEQLQQLQKARVRPTAVPNRANHDFARPQQVDRARPPRARLTLGNLPLHRDAVIGRQDETAAVRNLLRRSRLVTLTGSGGVGKSTVAIESLSQRYERFNDGIWLLDLTELDDGELLPGLIAATLAMPRKDEQPTADTIIAELLPREVLLILDNCEHVVAAVASLADVLLRECPGLRILATSRESLDIDGEVVLTISPLAFPATVGVQNPGGLQVFDAVTLFAERARAYLGAFALGESNAAAVASICARVEGNPLAIDLAAGRLRVISVHQIAKELSTSFDLLRSRGRRCAPSHQQSMTASAERSYQLCTAAERQLWEQVSIFERSFDLKAAQQICSDLQLNRGLIDELLSLVAKSILERHEDDCAVWFRLPATLRHFGAVRLAAKHALQQQLQQRYVHYYSITRRDGEHSEAAARAGTLHR